jgi:hypothetical protein
MWLLLCWSVFAVVIAISCRYRLPANNITLILFDWLTALRRRGIYMNKSSIQFPGFTSHQRAEFARTFAMGINGARPIVDAFCPLATGEGCHHIHREPHRAIASIHSMIDRPRSE